MAVVIFIKIGVVVDFQVFDWDFSSGDSRVLLSYVGCYRHAGSLTRLKLNPGGE